MIKTIVPLRRMSNISRLCCCLETENNLPFKDRDEYVGIQEHVGQHPKMNALMKHRFSHFHVNEIGLNGKIVYLTDLSAPPRPVDMTQDEPFYIHCNLYKERTSHATFLDYVIKELRIQPDDIGTAGIKDKWGQTSQKMSIRNVSPQRLVTLSDKSRHMKLGNFTYEKHPIRPGDLMGNHFKILLLNVESPNRSSSITEDVHKAMASLKDFGFINYYGVQRFSFGHKGQLIGKAMLQMNWDEVFDLILLPRKHDPDVIRAAKKRWFTERDPIDIVKNLPPDIDRYVNDPIPIWLLQGLAKHYDGGNGDLIQAYQTIPEHMRLLNYSAIKSFLWNHLVSFRIRTLGLLPVPGDIVHLKSESSDIVREGISDSLSHEIRVLTEDDFDSNGNCREHSICDVLLDLPGTHMTKYSNPKVQAYFEMLLEVNQLDVDCFAKLTEKFKEVEHRSTRNFRHIIQRPVNLTYKIVPYAQKNVRALDHIIPSDLDRLQTDELHTETEWKHIDNDKICVIVEFSLPKGTYATIALRELLSSTNVWK